MNPRRSFLIGVACLTGAAAVANAASVVRMDTATVVKNAKLVVHGTVIDNQVVFDNGPTGPANVRTITTIEVIESFKGDAGATVKVAGFGGQVGDFIYKLHGTPEFQIGDNVIVILSAPVPNRPNMKSLFAPLGLNGNLMVAGLGQGLFKISEDEKLGKVAVRSRDGLEFAGEVAVDDVKQLRRLGEVLTEIKEIVEVQRVEAERVNGTGGGK